MLKQVTHRGFSKIGQLIIIFVVIAILLALVIIMLTRASKTPVQTDQPLGTIQTANPKMHS